MVRFLSLDKLFEGRHFDREVIVLCVRWYLRFKLSYRDLVEMMAERGLSLAHTTIMRWVHHYAPEFERRWNRFARQAGPSWRVDETYVKPPVSGQLPPPYDQAHGGSGTRVNGSIQFKV
jgi:transposase-like protein